MDQEIWLTGHKGNRSVVSSSVGMDIVRYDRPPASEFFNFHLAEDILYTFIDIPYEPLEGVFPSLAAFRLYEDEVKTVTRNIRRWHPETRSDGIKNPVGIEDKFV
jgi:hypothetical protein